MTAGNESLLSTASVVLDDGRHVTLRSLDAGDARTLDVALEATENEDLPRSFLGVHPASHPLLARLRAAEESHDLALGAFTDDRELVAVAQFTRHAHTPAADVTVEVSGPWQRAGLGRVLLTRLVPIARAHGVTAFTATVPAGDTAVRRLLAELGPVREVSSSAGVGKLRVDLVEQDGACACPGPSPESPVPLPDSSLQH